MTLYFASIALVNEDCLVQNRDALGRVKTCHHDFLITRTIDRHDLSPLAIRYQQSVAIMYNVGWRIKVV